VIFCQRQVPLNSTLSLRTFLTMAIEPTLKTVAE
jgi:hypothetical protein